MKPNLRNIRRWHDALLGGKFKQGRDKLYDGKRYCCMGVACVLAGMRPRKIDGEFFFGQSAEVLPKTAQRFLGVNSECPDLDGIPADERNDGSQHGRSPRPQSFRQIAAAIRREWPEAFEKRGKRK